MEHGDHAAKARAKPTDGLRGKQDLRNPDARRLPLLEDALDGPKQTSVLPDPVTPSIKMTSPCPLADKNRFP